MGDSGSPAAQPVYSKDSKGYQDQLNDFLKGKPSRSERDSFLTNSKAPPDWIQGRPNPAVADYYNTERTYKQYNDYEDYLNNQLSITQDTEELANQEANSKAQTLSTAKRIQDLRRKQALDGAHNSQGVVTRAGSPFGAATILSSPLGQPGGYLATSKTILGS